MKETLLVFYLGDELFGIDITKVKEINRNVEFDPVPEAPKYVAGLFNMRGQIVTLFNLSEILQHENSLNNQQSACIILKTNPNNLHYVGLLIDKPKDVITIEDTWCELPPANLGNIEGKYLKEVVTFGNELIMIIDSEKILLNK